MTPAHPAWVPEGTSGVAVAYPVGESAQYSLPTILAVWASVTVPMGLLAFVAAPALIARSAINPGLVYWMLMVVGMVWQFVVSLIVLRLELKTLRWEVLKDRLWVTRPGTRRRAGPDELSGSGSSPPWPRTRWVAPSPYASIWPGSTD